MSQRNAPAVDVAVVGAGVIGLAIAWRAAQRGLRVAVFERDRAGAGSSRMAAGMLAPVSEAAAAEEALLELGLRSARDYSEFVAELREAADTEDVGYTRCGTLLVARDADEAEVLDRELELRHRWQLKVQRLRPSQARQLEPGLAPALRLALDVPDDHAVDPRKLLPALVAALRRAGGELHEQAVVSGIELTDGRAAGLLMADGSLVKARDVVVSAGSWTEQLHGIPESARIPVRPVKGQIMRLHDPAGPGLLTRVIRMGPTYIVPRGDGRYVLGATQEERGFDTTVTAGAGFELLRDASELVPGISELVIDEFAAGLRPATPDNLPVIGPSPVVPGLHWAVGHRRGGILLAPVTAELVCASLCGEASEPSEVSGSREPLAALFDPARYQHTQTGSPA